MNTPKITNHQLVQLLSNYWQWRWLWALTTGGFALFGIFYALFLKADTWVASQGLIVRDEANGAVMRLGRFQSQTEMKAAQETILEMARNSQVLRIALEKVGREPSFFGLIDNNSPPTASEIEALAQDGIEVRAPQGAELGTTEMIYLDVAQNSKERAVELNKAVCEALETQLQAVRKSRADGVIAELRTARVAVAENLEVATAKLKKMESEAGADLSDLRGMTDSVGGGATNRQVLDTIKTEIRSAELRHQQLSIDLQLAKESFQDPDDLLLTPGRLVDSQPGLRKLREGLSEATIRASELQGRFTREHPAVIAALETVTKIREQLREELRLSVQSLTRDLEAATQQLDKLVTQQKQLESRLARLAEIRAEYSNVVMEVRGRSQQLQETERELAQAEASREAALTSSLVTRLDEPMIGENPIGPGRSTIVAGATVSGLFFGLGLVFLLTPLDGSISYGRRRYDYSTPAGRRAADQMNTTATNRRNGDLPSENASAETLAAEQPAKAATESATEGTAKKTPAKSMIPREILNRLTKNRNIQADAKLAQSPAASFSLSKEQAAKARAEQSKADQSPAAQPLAVKSPKSSQPLKPSEILNSAVKSANAKSTAGKSPTEATATKAASDRVASDQAAEDKTPATGANPNLAEAQAVIAAALRGSFQSPGSKSPH